MKRKRVIISLIILLLLIAGALCGFLIYKSVSGSKEKNTVTEGTDLTELIKTNRDSAFSFLDKSERELPDDMRGYCIDAETDIDFSKTGEDELKQSVSSVFTKVDAILPNTVFIAYSGKDYTFGNFDCMQYLVDSAVENNMTVIFSMSAEDALTSGNKLEKTAVEAVEKYNIDGILIDGFFEKNKKSSDEELKNIVNGIREVLRGNNVFFGLTVSESGTGKNSVLNSDADFYVANINSDPLKAEASIKSWALTALKSSSKVYAVLRNDLAMSGGGWSKADDIVNEVKMLYNYGGFSGCVMYSHKKLSENDNDTATSLYSYYEYFGNVDYTALDLTGFKLKDESTIEISGTSDKNFPVYIWTTASGIWQTASATGDNGVFTVTAPLRDGANKIVVKHKNAMYTYHIDRAVDVMTSSSASVKDGTVNLTAVAKKGASVWASLANTVTVELSEVSDSSVAGYSTFTASYDLTAGLSTLKNNQVSFASVFNGIDEFSMCGESKEPSPYTDSGLGTALMCVVNTDYAETTSTVAEDDSSDPTCTPQLSRSYGYVNSISVSENNVNYAMTSGMKIHAADSTLIINGYILPDNNVTLESVETKTSTILTFSSLYRTFLKTNLDPQEYYTGYLSRIYNVNEFTAEYIDVIFMNTALCSMASEPDFSGSKVFSSAEWYTNKEENFITLRLKLREKGKFNGYSYYLNDNGQIVLSFKNDCSYLEGTVVMLDPGHGGYGSPGTASENKDYEKNITLSIAQETAEILRNYGATVILTRTDDDAVFLEERVKMIRSQNPDVFVSIHCDGADNTSWLGTHTFYYKSYSMPLAKSVHEQLLGAYRSYYYTDKSSDAYTAADKGFKFFPYMVTRVEECPSVLVECGYLSNATDSVFLTDENGRKIIATAIAQGIVDYIANY